MKEFLKMMSIAVATVFIVITVAIIAGWWMGWLINKLW